MQALTARLVAGAAVATVAGLGLGALAGSRITGDWSADPEGDRVIAFLAGAGATVGGGVLAHRAHAAFRGGAALSVAAPPALAGAALLGAGIGFALTGGIF